MSETTYGAEQRRIWKDPSEIAPAFVHLALQDASGIHDQYVHAWDLVCRLREGAATRSVRSEVRSRRIGATETSLETPQERR